MIVLLSLPMSSFGSTDVCKTVYRDSTVELCAEKRPGESIMNKQVYSVFARLVSNKERFVIANEIEIDRVGNTNKLQGGMYYYKAYVGGNSINAENRHVLLIVKNNKVHYAGEFSNVKTENSGLKAFYRYKEIRLGASHADDAYMMEELVVKNNKLVPKLQH